MNCLAKPPIFLFLFLCLILTTLQPVKGQQPNIVIILADDMGYGDPTCYNDSSKIPTPHIDQLAKEGIRFTDAHTPSSVCTPTRYGLLTGRYAWRTALQRSVLWPWDPPLITEERLTMPEMLQESGYATACIGKWHLGWQWQDKEGRFIQTNLPIGKNDSKKRKAIGETVDFSKPITGGPLSHGFDYYFGDDVPNFPPYIFIENEYTVGLPSTSKPKGMFGHEGPALPAWDLSMVMPTLAQRAAQYIDQRKASSNPFFLYLPLTAPHTPIAPSSHFIGKSEASWYGDYVVEVDWVVGQVMEALARNDMSENTLVIFTSDNGSPQRDGRNMNGPTGSVKAFGHDPSRPWRGMKSDIWEAGHRVPFIVSWKNRIQAGQLNEEPIILVDLMRSIADLVDYSLPKEAAEDSYNVLPALLGEKIEKSIRPHLIHHSGNGTFAIRKGDWKLILGRSSGGFTRYQPPEDAPAGQLYHLENDPGEQHNLYSEKPGKVEELRGLLGELREQGRSYKIGD